VIAASDQRREAAQRALADERAKRDALIAKQKAVEKEIGELAERLGVAFDTTPGAINDRIEAAQTRVRDIDAAIRPLRTRAGRLLRRSFGWRFRRLTTPRSAGTSSRNAAQQTPSARWAIRSCREPPWGVVRGRMPRATFGYTPTG